MHTHAVAIALEVFYCYGSCKVDWYNATAAYLYNYIVNMVTSTG